MYEQQDQQRAPEQDDLAAHRRLLDRELLVLTGTLPLAVYAAMVQRLQELLDPHAWPYSGGPFL